MTTQKVCNAIIYKETDKGPKYLILKRARYFNGAKWIEGNWTIPKALKEELQSDEAIVLEQVRKDAGITPQHVSMIGQTRPYVFYWEGQKVTRENHFILFKQDDSSIKLSEEYVDYHWGELKDVKRKMTFQSATQMFDLAEQMITGKSGEQSSTQL